MLKAICGRKILADIIRTRTEACEQLVLNFCNWVRGLMYNSIDRFPSSAVFL